MTKGYDRVYAGIELDNVKYNLDQIAKIIDSNTKIIGVIKTDGYGHGALPIAKELEKLDYIHGYGVATAEEALMLKNNGIRKPIIIIGYSFPSSYEEMMVRSVRLTVFRDDMLSELDSIAGKLGLKCNIHIKVDTGMGRIGIFPDDSGIEFVKKALTYKNLKLEGIFTHFARADELDKTSANIQYDLFNNFVNRIKNELDYEFEIIHCANSAAIIDMPYSNFSCVRAGIIMYGMWPSDEVNKEHIKLKPLLSLKSHITFIKEVKAGTPISYGGTYVTNGITKIATVPVGYGDGYPRSLSGKGYVIVNGQKVPILGRVCMDQFMIDISQAGNVKEGDEVTLIGNDGDATITMEDLMNWSGMLNYELACIIGKRVPRVYTKSGEILYTRDFFKDAPLKITR